MEDPTVIKCDKLMSAHQRSMLNHLLAIFWQHNLNTVNNTVLTEMSHQGGYSERSESKKRWCWKKNPAELADVCCIRPSLVSEPEKSNESLRFPISDCWIETKTRLLGSSWCDLLFNTIPYKDYEFKTYTFLIFPAA